MRYTSFKIRHYRAIREPLEINLKKTALVPLVGINECGKTTILQAIFCFDYINDSHYKGAHLSNCLNLYHTEEDDPEVAATIDIKFSDLMEACKVVVKGLGAAEGESDEKETEEEPSDSEGQAEEESSDSEEPASDHPFLQLKKKDFDGNLLLVRNLKSKKYSLPLFKDALPDDVDALAREIIGCMPYILYNDDFSDRPPNAIPIPALPPETATPEWLAMYEELFHRTNPAYSLFAITGEKDTRRRDSILSDVQAELNRTLLSAWKSFSPTTESPLTIKLTLNRNPNAASDKCPNQLKIQIVENVAKRERFFDVVDRSKGFLWFYNFVMKMEYNPKRHGETRETIYLLDEPGSYLHSSAQERLCQKIKAISDRHGKVIYCTHSHHLLNPDYIPLNKVYIVEKQRSKNIRVIPLPEYKTKTPSTSAMQPILEALHIPAFEFISDSSRVILVEGIYDKYAIELLCGLGDGYVVFPSTGADAIIKNIQFLNAYGKEYVALWDNDDEGRKEYERAKRTYGEHESLRFDLLPLLTAKNRRMEEMFRESDFQGLRECLDCSSEASYERILSVLYYAKKNKMKAALNTVSADTVERFAMLKKNIEKRFERAMRPASED